MHNIIPRRRNCSIFINRKLKLHGNSTESHKSSVISTLFDILLLLFFSNEPDIKSNQIKNQYNIIDSKENNIEVARKNSKQEGKQSQNSLHNGNRKKSKCRMTSVSIESLIESEDVSYIDDDIGKEIVKPIKENQGHQTENEEKSLKVSLSNALKD